MLWDMVLMIPGLGAVTYDGDLLVSDPRYVRILGKQCRLLIAGYEPEESANLTACVEAFCALDFSVLRSVTRDVFAYYRDRLNVRRRTRFPQITDPETVWDFVTLTQEPLLQRESVGGPWYVALENECSWEPEHGLMIVLKEGKIVTKVGEYDGNLINPRGIGDDAIAEGAIY